MVANIVALLPVLAVSEVEMVGQRPRLRHFLEIQILVEVEVVVETLALKQVKEVTVDQEL